MRQEGAGELEGIDIAFLSLNPDIHQDLISSLEQRGDRVHVNPLLELPCKTDLILIEASFSYFKIFKFLKRLQTRESTACVLLMGPDLRSDRMSALLRGGVFDYLKTPFPLQRLGKAIQKGLKNRENLLKLLALSTELELSNHSLSKERDQLKKWNNDLSQLYNLNQTLSESLHIDEIIKTSITDIKKIVAHDISCLFLKKWNQVHIETDRRTWGNLIEKVTEETRQDGLDFIKEEGHFPHAVVRHGGSEIMVHLAVGTMKIGLLRLIRMPDPTVSHPLGDLPIKGERPKGPFSEYQAKILSMIAAPLAIAVRNAEMYKQVEDLAVKDDLTNVLNRRAFSGILEREFRRANRYNTPLALLIIDLDFFKKINDTYGHLVGDHVLQEMAATFKSNLRDVDVLVRYGGEEFVVVLPGTNLREGLVVASRIKDQVEKKIFHQEGFKIHMTVSIGVANYPSISITSPKELFNRADQALYAAKKSGRNRIMILKSKKEEECSALALEGRNV